MSARQEQKAVDAARALNDRDRAILRALFDYKLLVTYQLKVLFFNTLRTCQGALKNLLEQGMVQRQELTQAVGIGRAQPLWTLTETGVQVVAVMMRRPRSKLKWMPRMAWQDSNDLLPHQLGINRFFVSLVEASLSIPGRQGLHKWTPESYVRLRDSWIKHDGFGRYLHDGGAVEFYLEYDRGTEHRSQLRKKLYGYITTSLLWAEEDKGYFPNLLVVTPNERRERHFEAALADELAALDITEKTGVELPFFIGSDDQLEEQGILGKVWRQFVPVPTNRPLAPLFLNQRLSLTQLPAKDSGPYDFAECLGRIWTDEVAKARRRRALRTAPTYPLGVPPGGDVA